MVGLTQDCSAGSGTRSVLLADLLEALGEASALLQSISSDDVGGTDAQALFHRIEAARIQVRLLQGVRRANYGNSVFREWLDGTRMKGFDQVGAGPIWALAASERSEPDECPTEPQRDHGR